MGAITIHPGKLAAQKNALRKALEKKLAATRDQIEAAIKPIVATAAEELGERTFPGPNAIGLAVAAMRFDISRVYITSGKAYDILEKTAGKAAASSFYAAFKRGDFSSARAILQNSGTSIASIRIGEPLDPQIRETMRDKKGRVISEKPLQIVSKEELQAFTKAAIAEIGKTSSGWYAAAAELGGNGNAIGWKGIGKHGSDGGSATIARTESKITITIRNSRPLARKHISPGQVAPIRNRAKKQIREAMKAAFRSA